MLHTQISTQNLSKKHGSKGSGSRLKFHQRNKIKKKTNNFNKQDMRKKAEWKRNAEAPKNGFDTCNNLEVQVLVPCGSKSLASLCIFLGMNNLEVHHNLEIHHELAVSAVLFWTFRRKHVGTEDRMKMCSARVRGK